MVKNALKRLVAKKNIKVHRYCKIYLALNMFPSWIQLIFLDKLWNQQNTYVLQEQVDAIIKEWSVLDLFFLYEQYICSVKTVCA